MIRVNYDALKEIVISRAEQIGHDSNYISTWVLEQSFNTEY